MDIDPTELIEKAKEGMRNAYVPMSGFPVGAAVMTSRGHLYQGCNVESVISGLGTCAERCAIDNAIANGEYKFLAICVVSRSEVPIRPCGACLQYIAEFAQVGHTDICVYMVGSEGSISEAHISELLPGAFGPRDLGVDLSQYE